jgi:hypothetical protein
VGGAGLHVRRHRRGHHRLTVPRRSLPMLPLPARGPVQGHSYRGRRAAWWQSCWGILWEREESLQIAPVKRLLAQSQLQLACERRRVHRCDCGAVFQFRLLWLRQLARPEQQSARRPALRATFHHRRHRPRPYNLIQAAPRNGRSPRFHHQTHMCKKVHRRRR